MRHDEEGSRGAASASCFNTESVTTRELYRKMYGEDAGADTWEHVQNEGTLGGMDHLSRTPDGSETVEGDAILKTLLATSTPRVGRRFPSEPSSADSDEQREHSYWQRRRVAQRKKYSVKQMTAQWEAEAAHFGEDAGDSVRGIGASNSSPDGASSLLFRDSPIRVRSPKMTAGLVDSPPAAAKLPTPSSQSPLPTATTEMDNSGGIVEEDQDSDDETTEMLLSRLRHVTDVTWRYFVLWFAAGLLLLCTVVVAVPYIRQLSRPLLPHCDSSWSATDSETLAINSIQELNQATALQPYVTLSELAERPSCQPCPLFGNCVGGNVISCSPPYELNDGVCVENPDVRADLARIASGIEQYVLARVSDRACHNISAWSYLTPALLKGDDDESFDLTTPITVLVSELYDYIAKTVHYGAAVLDLPRDEVFNRALVMALRNLRDIFVGGDSEGNGIVVVGTGLAPWTCQAPHLLYSHLYSIATAILIATAGSFWYLNSVTKPDRKQLVDRLFKEARFNLLRRAERADRLYPADHLREDVLDAYAIAPAERQQLRESTWPAVAVLLAQDPRIRSRTIKYVVLRSDVNIWSLADAADAHRLRGEDTLVLEWVSIPSSLDQRLTSPQRRRNRRQARMSLPANYHACLD